MPSKKKLTTAEDLYRFELIKEIQVSPDGGNIAYVLQRVNKPNEKKFANIWIVPTASGAPRQFTYGDHVDTHPRWSPDGSEIAFISNRGDESQSQIYIIPFSGGEARKLTDLKGSIAGFTWAPDGKSLAMMFQKKDKEIIEREKNPERKKLGVVDRHYDRLFYKADGGGFNSSERLHIWLVNARTGKAKQLTDHDVFDEWSPVFTPDGKHILFSSVRTPDPDMSVYDQKFYLIPVKGGKIKEFPIFEKGEPHLPSFSPDGKWLAFLGNEGEGDWWKNRRLWITPANGKGKPVCLTDHLDWDLYQTNINDVIGAVQMIKPTWSSDGKWIYFQVSRHGNTCLSKINVESREVENVIDMEGCVGAYGFDDDQSKLCYYHVTLTDIGQIHVRNMDTGKEKKLTKVNEQFLKRIDLGEIEEFWFKGSDGNDLQGWILKPPGFNPRKKYPSILEIHGGPLMMYGNMFMHEFYYLAANGYVVYFCNPRGGQGYGEKHAKAIWNGWGGKDYDDLMKFANIIARKPWIDKDRMGVTGGSYGGYMTNWIVGHTNRFAAAVTQRSVSNILSMWGTSDFNWIFQIPFGNKPPWENLNNMWKQSPMKYVGNVKTPTLVIHSEMDLRCQIEQGEQFFVALRTLGVDTEFVRFPGEPHGLSRGGRTDRRISRLKHILRWFDRYLKK